MPCWTAAASTRRGRPSAPAPASPPPAPPAASSDATPTVSVNLNRTVGENTTFHKTATERQKFQVHIDFGKVFETQGNLDRAVQEYQDALKVAEARGHGELNAADEALAHRRIASALDRLGQFRQSEAHYQKAQKLAPKDPKVWNDAGYSYYLQGRWAEAERSLRTAMKLAPDDARVRTNLGMTLAAAGKTEEALPLLSTNQGDAIGHANLGYLLASTGQYERARQEYQAALSMRPDLAAGPPGAGAARPPGAGDRGAAADRDRRATSPPATRPRIGHRRSRRSRRTSRAGPRRDPAAAAAAAASRAVARRAAQSRVRARECRRPDSRSFSPVGRDQDLVEPRPAIADPIDLVTAGDADQVLLPGAGRVDLGR